MRKAKPDVTARIRFSHLETGHAHSIRQSCRSSQLGVKHLPAVNCRCFLIVVVPFFFSFIPNASLSQVNSACYSLCLRELELIAMAHGCQSGNPAQAIDRQVLQSLGRRAAQCPELCSETSQIYTARVADTVAGLVDQVALAQANLRRCEVYNGIRRGSPDLSLSRGVKCRHRDVTCEPGDAYCRLPICSN